MGEQMNESTILTQRRDKWWEFQALAHAEWGETPLKNFFIEVWLICNVVLIYTVQQNDSVMHIYSFSLWLILGY